MKMGVTVSVIEGFEDVTPESVVVAFPALFESDVSMRYRRI